MLLPEQAQRAALLVEHNVESQLLAQRAALSRDPVERITLRRDAARTRRDEMESWRQVGGAVAVADEDANAIKAAVPSAHVMSLPNGADHLGAVLRETGPGADAGSCRLLFVAALGYEPNQETARLLLTEIFPAVLRRSPDATLAVVGSAPPRWLQEAAHREPRLTVTGWVPDVAPWLDAADVVVCPLAVAGGVKVKVLGALARDWAIVATPVALQGLRRLPAGAVVERADPCGFAEACIRLLASLCECDRQRVCAAEAA